MSLGVGSRFKNLQIVLAVIWLVLTSSLTLWWMIFAMRLIAEIDVEMERHRTMLFWEGATLLALLLIGGSLLIYFTLQEKRQAQMLKLFFAGFTHDVKTRLAGVKLQAEILRDDNQDTKLSGAINRLLTDTSRLQVQVENSLFVGGSQKNELFAEDIQLSELLNWLGGSWPQLRVVWAGDAIVCADRRAFENVATNIFHNALSHGEASEIRINIESLRPDRVRLEFIDNGRGFSGDVSRLGEVFYRHNPSSGSGLGLYAVREIVRKMGGAVEYGSGAGGKGFRVVMELPGRTGEGSVARFAEVKAP